MLEMGRILVSSLSKRGKVSGISSLTQPSLLLLELIPFSFYSYLVSHNLALRSDDVLHQHRCLRNERLRTRADWYFRLRRSVSLVLRS